MWRFGDVEIGGFEDLGMWEFEDLRWVRWGSVWWSGGGNRCCVCHDVIMLSQEGVR